MTATWTDLLGNAQQRDVDLTAGKPVTIDNLPLGVEIHVVAHSESTEALVTVVGEEGSTASISLTNEVEESPDLAMTGVDSVRLMLLVGISLSLLIGGAGLLYYRVRRN